MNRALVDLALRAAGMDPAQVLGTVPVGGGCINDGLRVRTKGRDFFLKWNAGVDHRFFLFEAEGLGALANTASVATPIVLARSVEGSDVPWLLLEWIDEARPGTGSWRRLGRELAALHRVPLDDDRYGWHSDNVIGSLPQPNRWMDDWGDFWAERRILPLARELRERNAFSVHQLATVEGAATRVGRLLNPVARADGRSLLHGDLWSGNVMFTESRAQPDGSTAPDGSLAPRDSVAPVLIDPSVYVGHREVDLAMSNLFGGFPSSFYRAYDKAWPLHPGHERRRPAYQLYPLLVHARLFGGGYVASAVRAAEAIPG